MNTATNHYTAADGGSERDRNAFNAAFYELGLPWHWDSDTYRILLGFGGEPEQIRAYLERYQSHMLAAYDVDFLAEVIRTAKARCCETMGKHGARELSAVDWAEFQGVQVGV